MAMWEDIAAALVAAGPGEEPGTLMARFRFPEDLKVFQGHFPGRPLLPGAMQVEMVPWALGEITGRAYRITGVKKAKFMGQVLPGHLITLTMTVMGDDANLQVRSRLQVEGKVVASMVLNLAREACSPGVE